MWARTNYRTRGSLTRLVEIQSGKRSGRCVERSLPADWTALTSCTQQPYAIESPGVPRYPAGLPTQAEARCRIHDNDPNCITALALEDCERFVGTVVDDGGPCVACAPECAGQFDVRRKERPRFVPSIEAL